MPIVDYVTDLLPPLVLFGVGLSMTVAPLTSTVLADADEYNAGIASGMNNAIARLAGLLGLAIVGPIVAARYGDGADGSVGAFHLAMAIAAGPGGPGRPRGSDRHPQSPPEGGGQELRGRAAGGCPGRGGVPGRERAAASSRGRAVGASSRR